MAKREDVILQALRDLNQKIDHHHDSANSRLTAIEKVQVKQQENLAEHMRRTELLEESQAALRIELAPIKKHVIFIESSLKAVGVLATVVSIVAGILKIVDSL